MFMNMFWCFFFVILTGPSMGQVLELGESQLHGKKDQPEAMTFITRAELPDSQEVIKERKTSYKIMEEIKSSIFDLSTDRF